MSELNETNLVRQSQDMSNEINEITLALSKAQSELGAAHKATEGYGYSYADLATVIEVAKEILAKHGLAVTQLIGNSGSNPAVTTILAHTSGQWFKSIAVMPTVEMKGCNVAQKMGATISYLRRYAYQAILGMASEDNDASSKGFDKPKVSEGKPKAPKDGRAPFRSPKKPKQTEASSNASHEI